MKSALSSTVEQSAPSIDKHELAARVQRLVRRLLAPGTAVLEGLDGIAGPTVTILSLGRRNG